MPIASRYAFLAFPLTFVVFACAQAPGPLPVPSSAPAMATAYPVTPPEEAVVLRLEDRREFDPAIVQTWATHANSAHRRRIAMALGRIGPATFLDENGNGVRDENEQMAGVAVLSGLAEDGSSEVREAAAFALGEIGDPAGIPALLALANDPEHAGVSAEAIEALSKLALGLPFQTYSEFISPSRPVGVRARAIRFLFRFETPEAANLAATWLAETNADVRREAAYSLSRRSAPEARYRLQLLLTDPDTLTRSYSARALGRIADPQSVPFLFEAISDTHPWVRVNALVALDQIAAAHPHAVNPSAAELLGLLSLTRDADPGVRISAIPLIGRLSTTNEQARSRLLSLAAEGASWLREVATAAAVRYLATTHAGEIDALLETDSRFIRIRALEATGDDEAGSRIRERLFRDPDPAVRAAALSAIPSARLGVMQEEIERALDDEDPVVRSVAIGRFAELPGVDSAVRLARLRAALTLGGDDEMNDAAVAAVSAIAAMEEADATAVLHELASSNDPVVRRIVAEAREPTGGRRQYTPLPIEKPLSWYEDVARWAQESHSATLETSRGLITLALMSREAPLTAWNFVELARKGYFDGTTFMRVVPNFVVQGGDPRNDQSGGPGYAIRDEINLQKYTRGAVGMALSGPDTGGSQFFITHSPQPHLDGGYTIFGRVAGGMSGVVDQLERGDILTAVIIDQGQIDEIDERLAAVEQPPLPVEVGPTSPERLLILPEYRERMADYEPDPAVVEMIAASVQQGDRISVYLGTWCADSQREIPRFLKILQLAEQLYGTSIPVDWIAIDRSKREPAALVEGKSIALVPTFIYYRSGEEIGRIVERSEGLFEDHLLRLAATP
jgi:cyclophilin family peptidyl-prolyl cis-trans isomerase/HEAT repeat protein/thiol-disulfide isomerase/thioredoxin